MEKIGVLVMVAVCCGCAVTKQWVPTGGSRADGTVKLSYQFALLESPQVDPQQGAAAARAKCKAWGYEDAEAFGGQTQVCNNFTSSGCNSWVVTAEYQCIGNPGSR